MPKTRPRPLPAQIYVVWEGGDDIPYLTASETSTDIEHGQCVGIYELRETKTMRVTRELK